MHRAGQIFFGVWRERNVDFIIGRLLSRTEEDLAAEPLFDEPMFVVAGAQS